VRLFPFVHLTKRSKGIRMGSGRGSKVYSSVIPMVQGYLLSSIRFPRRSVAQRIYSRFRCKLSIFIRLRMLKVSCDLVRFSHHERCRYVVQESLALGKFNCLVNSYDEIPDLILE